MKQIFKCQKRVERSTQVFCVKEVCGRERERERSLIHMVGTSTVLMTEYLFKSKYILIAVYIFNCQIRY